MKTILNYIIILALVWINACTENSSPVEPPVELGDDYFPLNEGNQWEYEFYGRYSSPSAGSKSIFEGTRVWEIISAASNADTNYYHFKESYTGVKSDTNAYYQPPVIYTRQIDDLTAYFTIIVYPDNSIHARADDNSQRMGLGEDQIIDLINLLSFKKYHTMRTDTIRAGETNKLQFFRDTILLKKDTGIVEFEIAHGGNTTWYSHAVLKSFFIQPGE